MAIYRGHEMRRSECPCWGDPARLSGADDILPHLRAGGWSAVADLSKFFYNFPYPPADRAFFGCVHPGAGESLCYYGLPMGSGSSPGWRVGMATSHTCDGSGAGGSLPEPSPTMDGGSTSAENEGSLVRASV